jgi:hypothetical protein
MQPITIIKQTLHVAHKKSSHIIKGKQDTCYHSIGTLYIGAYLTPTMGYAPQYLGLVDL